ncbi:hypothetical protein SEA_FREDDYB_70 [Mycobacterium phage FreddyB]
MNTYRIPNPVEATQ